MDRVIVVVLAGLLVSCGPLTDGVLGPRGAPLPEPTTEPRTEHLDDGAMVRMWPRSARVEEGVAYRMATYTHCGLDYALDFDGSFWEVVSGPTDRRTSLDDPEDEGTITLVETDRAVYESSTGAQFELRRTDGPREVHVCE